MPRFFFSGLPRSSWVASRASVKHRGKYMGIYTMAWGLGFVLGPPIGMWIYQHLGPDTLWFAVGVLGVLIWIGCEVLQRVLRRSSEAPGDWLRYSPSSDGIV